MLPFAIAIDGPGGVGKSTTARKVAEKLGFTYIDTGAMYRAVALYNLRQQINVHNEAAVSASLCNIEIMLHRQHIFLNGEDISADIRTQAVADATSIIAAYAPVRKKLVAEQQALAETTSVVMDGRDIASAVLPWAQVKIYLDAKLKTRAARRHAELIAKGQHRNLDDVIQDTKIRDERDCTRLHAPLIRVPEAVYIDNTTLTTEEVVAQIIALVTYIMQKKEHPSCATE